MPTIFTGEGKIDLRGQRSVVRHCMNEGAAGIACLLFAGEFYKLSDHEREEVAAAVVDEAGGKVPVLVGVSHSGTLPSVELGRHAGRVGADGVIVTPPYHANFVAEARSSLLRHYSALAKGVGLPIMIQDFETKEGVHLKAEQVEAIADKSENVRYVKVEGENQLGRIKEIVRVTGGRVDVFGGMAGVYLLEEMRAGIKGSIPGAGMVGHLVRAFNAQVAGDIEEAEKTMKMIRPYLDFFISHFESFVSVEKEVLAFRGVIENPTVREPAVPLPEKEKAKLTGVLRGIDGGGK